MSWSDPYVGLPFAERTGEAGANCWGLVCMVYADQRSIELPRYSETGAPNNDAERQLVEQLVRGQVDSGSWRPVMMPMAQPFDVLLMRAVRAWHVGIVVERGRMLHCFRGSQAAVDAYTRAPWSKCLNARGAGAYRYETRRDV